MSCTCCLRLLSVFIELVRSLYKLLISFKLIAGICVLYWGVVVVACGDGMFSNCDVACPVSVKSFGDV